MIDFNCRLFDSSAIQSAGEAWTDASFDLGLQRWFEQMAEKGPKRIVAHSFDATERALCIQAAAQHPQAFTALGGVDPTDKADTASVLRALEGGFLRGVCLFPSVHGYDLGAPGVLELLGAASEQRALVAVRCGLPPSVLRDAPGVRWNIAAMNPLEVVPLADRFGELTFVLPAFGGGFLRETLMLGHLCDNVVLDTAQPAWLATQATPMGLEDVFERCLDVFSTSRLLFATGSSSASPGWRGDWHTLQREALGALELGAEDVAAILGGNAHELLAG